MKMLETIVPLSEIVTLEQAEAQVVKWLQIAIDMEKAQGHFPIQLYRRNITPWGSGEVLGRVIIYQYENSGAPEGKEVSMKYWKLEITLTSDNVPEPLTLKEIYDIADTLNLPAGVKVKEVDVIEGPETK